MGSLIINSLTVLGEKLIVKKLCFLIVSLTYLAQHLYAKRILRAAYFLGRELAVIYLPNY